MSKEEHKKEHEEEQEGELSGVRVGLTLGSVASAAFGLLVATGTLAAKIVTGDVLGAAEAVSTTFSVISKASGLSPVIDKAGKYLKEKFGDSKVLGFIGKAWEVVTSRPVKMGLKTAGIGFGIAALVVGVANPFTAVPAIILAAGTIITSTLIGSRSIGRSKRIEQETKDTKDSVRVIGGLKKGKNPALDLLLASKLANNKVSEVDGAKVAASTARGSILESAALILEAASDAGDPIVGAAAAGVAIFGGLAYEANEAIERQEKRNRLLADREEARAQLVCAVLAKEPDIDKLTPRGLEEKYNEVYKANFQKSFGTKVKNFFKDVGSGAEEYIFGRLKKVFSKKEEHEAGADAHAKQHVAEVGHGLQHKRTADAVAPQPKQIPAYIEVEAGHGAPPAPSPTISPTAAPSPQHSLDPHFMETHTHVDKTEHSPHLGEGGGKVATSQVKSR